MKISRPHASRPNKYGARKTADGHASRKESRRSLALHILQRAGEISNLREQVKFELIPTQRDTESGRVIERACHYVADFTYTDKARNFVVEDTKGFRTPEYRIKRKLMLYVYGIRIKES